MMRTLTPPSPFPFLPPHPPGSPPHYHLPGRHRLGLFPAVLGGLLLRLDGASFAEILDLVILVVGGGAVLPVHGTPPPDLPV